MAYLKKIYFALIHTNVLIAFAACAQCALTYLILDIPMYTPVLVVEGSSTLLLYNLSLLLSKPADPQASPYARTRWVFSHLRLFWFNSVLAVALLCYALSQLHMHTWLYLLLIGVASCLYALPILRIAGVKAGARQLPYVKLFYIAVIWSLSTVGLPTIEAHTDGLPIDWYKANYLGLVKIVFLLLLTLPFDIRDMRQDAYYQLKTIPNLLGRERSVYLCYLLLIVHAVLICFSPYLWVVKVGLLCTNIFVAAVYRFVVFSKQSYHQVYLLDVGLIIQFVLVWLLLSLF